MNETPTDGRQLILIKTHDAYVTMLALRLCSLLGRLPWYHVAPRRPRFGDLLQRLLRATRGASLPECLGGSPGRGATASCGCWVIAGADG